MRTAGRRSFVLGASALALALPSRAHAAGVTAELRASSTSLLVGDELVLELEVTREGGGGVPDPEIPAGLAGGFEITSRASSGSGIQFSFGGGRSSRSSHSSMVIAAIALAPGKYELSFAVDDAGTAVKSNVIEVVVEGQAAASTEEPAIAKTGKPTEARGDVFVWSATDKSKAYIGEQIEYRLDVYERSLLSSVSMRTPPSFADFYTYDLPEGEAVVEEVGGVPYRVRPGMRRALFPQKAGTLTIGSPEITIGRRRRDRGEALSIEVLPLPAKGQPPAFSPNNVGKFSVTTKADRTAVDVGQPFTWTVEITGDGNVALVDPGPWPEVAGVRRYEPKIESQMRSEARVSGTRTYSFLVIPETPGKLTMPAVELDYFDPEAAKYAVARGDAIEIEVKGTAIEPTAPSTAPVPDDAADEPGFAPIIDQSTLPRDPAPKQWLTPTRWAWAMAALPTVAATAWAGNALWRKYGPDDDARRRTALRRRRRERLDAARDAVDTGDGFHAAIATLLHDLAVGRIGSQGVGLPRPQLVRLLESCGTPPSELRKLESLLDRCDAARFAAQRGTIDERRDMLEDALALVERSSLARDDAGGAA
jgi:hypothetical protein